MSKFYFDKVTIDYAAGNKDGGLLTFSKPSSNVLSLLVDGTKNEQLSSISLTKKEIPFPKKIVWDIVNHNEHGNNITLEMECVDAKGLTLKRFWMKLNPFANTLINYIPESAEKILITCYHENVIGKKATVTITSKS